MTPTSAASWNSAYKHTSKSIDTYFRKKVKLPANATTWFPMNMTLNAMQKSFLLLFEFSSSGQMQSQVKNFFVVTKGFIFGVKSILNTLAFD